MEFETQKRHKTKKGEQWVTNNRAYLFDVRFEESKFPIEQTVRVFRNGKDIANRLGRFLVPFISILVIGQFFSFEQIRPILETVSNEPLAWVVLSLAIVAWGFHALGRRSKGYVRLESPEFEKRFDVFGDEVEARKLLTPSFMERLAKFVEEDAGKRNIEFAFLETGFRMVVDLMKSGGTMEFSKFGGAKGVDESIVRFYLELKAVVSLAEDLNLAYYARKRTKEPIPTSSESAETSESNGTSS